MFSSQLQYEDIRKTMRELFYYHVEFKDLTPQLARRSFKLYIERFDRQKIYLLRSEVDPFLELSDAQIDQVIRQYSRDEFTGYERLNHLISESIKRSRRLRKEVEAALLAGESVEISASSLGYAENEVELKARLARQLQKVRTSKPGHEKKAIALWERRLQRKEQDYVLFSNKGSPLTHPQVEHNVTTHTLKALARSLDAHTEYFSPKEAYEIRANLSKQLVGIGVIPGEEVDGVYVNDLIENGPAYKSGGVEVGDRLTHVNGQSIEQMSFEKVLDVLKGPEGSRVQLGLERNAQFHTVDLKREKITVESELVSYGSQPFADGHIGVISLPSFYRTDRGAVDLDLRHALRELKNQGDLHGLVIDMRNNPGGYVSEAVKIAGMFITQGIIVISKYAEGEVEYSRNLDGRVFYDGPLVLLTSKASASAAEIVSGALQDYGVALVVGDTTTYGKGTMQYQTMTTPKAKRFFAVTVGRYYTVSGRSTQIRGVDADIHVASRYAPYKVGERYLQYPLTADNLPESYIDPLTGLDSNTKKLLQKKYVPYLQKPERRWRQMLPVLRANSKKRLSKNTNYQTFLKASQGQPYKKNYGVADIQLAESINIIKDMHQISLAKKNH